MRRLLAVLILITFADTVLAEDGCPYGFKPDKTDHCVPWHNPGTIKLPTIPLPRPDPRKHHE